MGGQSLNSYQAALQLAGMPWDVSWEHHKFTRARAGLKFIMLESHDQAIKD
jgi:hypothetical protein